MPASSSPATSTPPPDEVPVLAIRGNVEDTGNGDLAGRVLVPVEQTIPEPARYTLFHQGRGNLLDHMLNRHAFDAASF